MTSFLTSKSPILFLFEPEHAFLSQVSEWQRTEYLATHCADLKYAFGVPNYTRNFLSLTLISSPPKIDRMATKLVICVRCNRIERGIYITMYVAGILYNSTADAGEEEEEKCTHRMRTRRLKEKLIVIDLERARTCMYAMFCAM